MTLEAIENINIGSLLDTLISLIVAFIGGAIIGIERQYRQRTAGLRTNVLVAVGAAIFVDMANRLTGHSGAVHVVAYVVSGIGFLGAGVILRDQGNVRGLNTAATLWGSAAIGACAGADLIMEAALGVIFILASNILLRPVVNMMNKQPINPSITEITNRIFVICHKQNQKKVFSLLEYHLNRFGLPSEIDMHAFGSDDIEFSALLISYPENTIIDDIVAALNQEPEVKQVFWSASALD